jgi:hypothetical protein
MKTPHTYWWATVAIWGGVVFAAILVANTVSLSLHDKSYHVSMRDGVDRLLIDNVHNPEEDAQGNTYRWTRDHTQITIDSFAAVSRAYLTLHMGGLPQAISAPRQVELHLNGQPWQTMEITNMPRTYTYLLPPAAVHDGSLAVVMQNEVSKIPPDTRQLGVRIDGLTVGWFSSIPALPTWQLILAQWLTVMGGIVLLWRLAIPQEGIVVAVAVIIIAQAWITGDQLLVALSWHYRICLSTAAVVIAQWASFPLLTKLLPEEEVRRLWIVGLIAFTIRMVFLLYPPFNSHDWYIHRRRIHDFLGGSFLIYDKPAEFSRKLTIVPPAPYLFYAPVTLLTASVVVAMQAVYAFIDSMSTLLVGLLVRRIGGSRRAAWSAALIFALFPLNLTALWWGFGPQVIGQQLMLLLALLVAYTPAQHRWFWVIGWLVFCIMLLSHIGAGILGGTFLSTYIVLMWLLEPHDRHHWLRWGVVLVTVGIAVFFLLYIDVIGLQFRGLAGNQRLGWDEGDWFRYLWTLETLYSSFHPLGVIVPLVSIIHLARRTTGAHHWLVIAWLASAELFFVVDLAFGLQVRYAYFILPLVVAGLALLIDGLPGMVDHFIGTYASQRVSGEMLGELLRWGIILTVSIAGMRLWIEGIFYGVKPSLRGLTH